MGPKLYSSRTGCGSAARPDWPVPACRNRGARWCRKSQRRAPKLPWLSAARGSQHGRRNAGSELQLETAAILENLRLSEWHTLPTVAQREPCQNLLYECCGMWPQERGLQLIWSLQRPGHAAFAMRQPTKPASLIQTPDCGASAPR